MAHRMGPGGVQVFVLTHRLPNNISLKAWDVHVLGEEKREEPILTASTDDIHAVANS